ncbi:hypothetical protein HOD29_01000 [archaeon]|jgi:hypothetical protein|nr:hypothetical protein [archaeon]
MKTHQFILFALYVLVGLYITNLSFEFMTFPELFINFNSWIILVGGILCLIGALNYLKMANTRRRK